MEQIVEKSESAESIGGHNRATDCGDARDAQKMNQGETLTALRPVDAGMMSRSGTVAAFEPSTKPTGAIKPDSINVGNDDLDSLERATEDESESRPVMRHSRMDWFTDACHSGAIYGCCAALISLFFVIATIFSLIALTGMSTSLFNLSQYMHTTTTVTVLEFPSMPQTGTSQTVAPMVVRDLEYTDCHTVSFNRTSFFPTSSPIPTPVPTSTSVDIPANLTSPVEPGTVHKTRHTTTFVSIATLTAASTTIYSVVTSDTAATTTFYSIVTSDPAAAGTESGSVVSGSSSIQVATSDGSAVMAASSTQSAANVTTAIKKNRRAAESGCPTSSVTVTIFVTVSSQTSTSGTGSFTVTHFLTTSSSASHSWSSPLTSNTTVSPPSVKSSTSKVQTPTGGVDSTKSKSSFSSATRSPSISISLGGNTTVSVMPMSTVFTTSIVTIVTGVRSVTSSSSIVTAHNVTYSMPQVTHRYTTITSGANSNHGKTSSDKSRSGTAVSYCIVMVLAFHLIGYF